MLIEMLKSLLRKIFGNKIFGNRIFGQYPARARYRPERHYMRGPGPKSRAREIHR